MPRVRGLPSRPFVRRKGNFLETAQATEQEKTGPQRSPFRGGKEGQNRHYGCVFTKIGPDPKREQFLPSNMSTSPQSGAGARKGPGQAAPHLASSIDLLSIGCPNALARTA